MRRIAADSINRLGDRDSGSSSAIRDSRFGLACRAVARGLDGARRERLRDHDSIAELRAGVLAEIVRRQPASKERTAFAWQLAVGPALARATTVELDATAC